MKFIECAPHPPDPSSPFPLPRSFVLCIIWVRWELVLSYTHLVRVPRGSGSWKKSALVSLKVICQINSYLSCVPSEDGRVETHLKCSWPHRPWYSTSYVLGVDQDYTHICLVKAMVFPVVMYGYESWIIKKAERWRIDAFELWCWRRLLRVPWTARRSNQSILKEISPEYSLQGMMLKLKLQYFGHLLRRTDSLEKTLMLGKIEGRRTSG